MFNPTRNSMMLLFRFACVLALFTISHVASAATNADKAFPVSITVNAAKPVGELTPIWRFFGADEPNYAYMKDGRKLLSELGRLGKPQVYFRAHHLQGLKKLKHSS